MFAVSCFVFAVGCVIFCSCRIFSIHPKMLLNFLGWEAFRIFDGSLMKCDSRTRVKRLNVRDGS